MNNDIDIHEIELRILQLEKQVYDLIINKHIEELKENGYTIIPNVLNDSEVAEATKLFFNWKNSIPDIDKLHSIINPHGIFKFHQIGHQEHAWYIRTRPKIIEIFKQIWNTEELVVSFDGSCYIPKNFNKKDNTWTHTDQAPNAVGEKCFQSFVSLTKNENTTIVLYEKSNHMHEKYFSERNIKDSKNWHLIDIEYLKSIEHYKKILSVNPGDLVIWDSRTFHQNQYGGKYSEERIVQYICYLPKNHPLNTENQQKKRLKYFNELRTTSHWPYPLKVNSLQPQTYGDKSKLIDYSMLPRPDLSKYAHVIKTLI